MSCQRQPRRCQHHADVCTWRTHPQCRGVLCPRSRRARVPATEAPHAAPVFGVRLPRDGAVTRMPPSPSRARSAAGRCVRSHVRQRSPGRRRGNLSGDRQLLPGHTHSAAVSSALLLPPNTRTHTHARTHAHTHTPRLVHAAPAAPAYRRRSVLGILICITLMYYSETFFVG